MSDRQWTRLAPGFQIRAGRVPFYDSWLLVEIDGLRLLNWNDCEPTAPGAIVACDDHGFDSLRDAVRAAADDFLRDRSEQALHLPSGQCLLIRPPKT